MKRTISQARATRFSEEDVSIDVARFTLTAVGDATEFGGFGGGVGEDGFRIPTMTLRRKRLLGRAALRRRPTFDFELYAKP